MIEFIFGSVGVVVFILVLLLLYWVTDLDTTSDIPQPTKTTACNQRCHQGRYCNCYVCSDYDHNCDMSVTEYDQRFEKRI